MLDSRLLYQIVAPALGLGSTYRSVFGQTLTVPVWIYDRLRRWHHLSFLKTTKNVEMLQEIASTSAEPGKIRALWHIIDDDLGYHLYRAVERAKVDLSTREATRFRFEDGELVIEAPVTRGDFEAWIAADTAAMAECVDRVLDRANVEAADVDRVFMTGGTSFVPAVRRIFDERFGAAKIEAGGEMISVATGLALRAREGLIRADHRAMRDPLPRSRLSALAVTGVEGRAAAARTGLLHAERRGGRRRGAAVLGA